MICGDEIVTLVFRDLIAVPFPKIREDLRRSVLIEPLQLFLSRQEDPAKDQSKTPIGMRDAIRQAQSAAPRTAEDVPFFNTEFFTQRFNVIYQIPRRVLFQLRVRRRFPGTALIEQYDVIGRRIEKLPVHRNQSAARPAMQKDNRNAFGIPDAFVVDLVNIGDLQHPRIERFDLRI